MSFLHNWVGFNSTFLKSDLSSYVPDWILDCSVALQTATELYVYYNGTITLLTWYCLVFLVKSIQSNTW